ncbi:hypothetical protein BJ912DRAFT_1148514 [Pholiota molesta]|nr:hypothetical protein BJ912DRAFT_1148514 [Pholiota molesta]
MPSLTSLSIATSSSRTHIDRKPLLLACFQPSACPCTSLPSASSAALTGQARCLLRRHLHHESHLHPDMISASLQLFRMSELDNAAREVDLVITGTVVMKSWLMKDADEMESGADSVVDALGAVCDVGNTSIHPRLDLARVSLCLVFTRAEPSASAMDTRFLLAFIATLVHRPHTNLTPRTSDPTVDILSNRTSAARATILRAHHCAATLVHRPHTNLTPRTSDPTVDILSNRTSAARATILRAHHCARPVRSSVPNAGSWLRELDGATRRGWGSKMHLSGAPPPRPVSAPFPLITGWDRCGIARAATPAMGCPTASVRACVRALAAPPSPRSAVDGHYGSESSARALSVDAPASPSLADLTSPTPTLANTQPSAQPAPKSAHPTCGAIASSALAGAGTQARLEIRALEDAARGGRDGTVVMKRRLVKKAGGTVPCR